tara:strand:- start:278 stop:454 length:177 start_codon:yes stop_codon:yes gene_type:complete
MTNQLRENLKYKLINKIYYIRNKLGFRYLEKNVFFYKDFEFFKIYAGNPAKEIGNRGS